MIYKVLMAVFPLFFFFSLNAEDCSIFEKDNNLIKKCTNKTEKVLFDNSKYSYFVFSTVGDYTGLSRIPNDSPYGVSEEKFIFKMSDESVYTPNCLTGIIALVEGKEGFVEVMRDADSIELNLKELDCNVSYKKWLGISLNRKAKNKISPPQFKEFPVKQIYKGKNHKLVLDDFKYYIKHQEGVWSELVIYKNNDNTFMYIASSSSKASTCPIKAKIDNHTQIALYQPVYSVIEEATFDNKKGNLKLQKVGNKIIITDFYIPEYCGLFTDMSGSYSSNNKEKRIILTEHFGKSSLTELTRTINKKNYLFKNATDTKKTKMYLIKGDEVTLLDKKIDDSGQKWYFINYKGKKDLNMWIKAEAINIETKTNP